MSKKKNVFLKQWKAHQMTLLKANFPDRTEDEIEAFLEKKIKTDLENPDGLLVNNYVNKSIKVNLLDLVDWMATVEPIIAGNGTFFKNQNQGENPAATMLDNFLIKRKKYKSNLHIYDKDSYEYATFDRLQKSEKINANSYYGGSGNEAFIFFNLFCAVAVTSTAQSLISTTETAFEAFLANNMPYINLDDCMNFINNTLNDPRKLDGSFLVDIDIETLLNRLIENFREYKPEYGEYLRNLLLSLTQDELNRLYYKNNIYEFALVPKIYKKLTKIFKTLTVFRDPNTVPKEIQEDISNIWEYFEEFVMYNHFVFNRIQRLKYERRKSVIVVDTDSNMIQLSPWIKFITDELYMKNDDVIAGKSEEDLLYNAINVMNYFITQMVNNTLKTYTKTSNILKEYRPRINMKNEFLYMRMALSKVKKRYIGSVRLREGEEFIPEKLDIKGHDFVKSSCTPEVKEFMEQLVLDEILYSKDISVARILRRLTELENIIMDSLKNSEKKFFLPRQVKEMDAYKKPMSIQQFKATLHWNLIYPDIPIELPSNVYVIKMRLGKGDSIEELRQKYPDVYRRISKNLFNSGIEGISDKELKTIAIPSNLSEIPEWIIEFIDYETMVNDNVSKFYPVLESLGVVNIKAKSSVLFFSNILDI